MKFVASKIQYVQRATEVDQTVRKNAPELVIGQIKGIKRTKITDQW